MTNETERYLLVEIIYLQDGKIRSHKIFTSSKFYQYNIKVATEEITLRGGNVIGYTPSETNDEVIIMSIRHREKDFPVSEVRSNPTWETLDP